MFKRIFFSILKLFFKIWRRAYDIPPPLMDANDPELPEKDPKYAVIFKDFRH